MPFKKYIENKITYINHTFLFATCSSSSLCF